MLASHDSFTYLRALQWRARMCPVLWRTQTLSIPEQLKAGVIYFDIRVRWDKKKRAYRVCHGLVDFNRTYGTLAEIINIFSPYLVRIILERGDSVEFEKEAKRIVSLCGLGLYGNLHLLAVKHPWTGIYHASTVICPETGLVEQSPKVVDHTYVPWDTGKSFWENVKRFRFSTIRRWARLHPVTEEQINSRDTVHFHDFVDCTV